MVTYQVDILNPKADRLLKDLADMDLIAIKQTAGDGFMQVVERLRSKAAHLTQPTLEEITEEVETVRAERHAPFGVGCAYVVLSVSLRLIQFYRFSSSRY